MNLLVGIIRIRREKSLFTFGTSVRQSVRPSVRTYRLGSHWTDFREIWYWRLLWSSVERVQIWLKPNHNIRYFALIPKYVLRWSKFAIRGLSSGKVVSRYYNNRGGTNMCERATVWRSTYIAYLILLFSVACVLLNKETRVSALLTVSDTFVFFIVYEPFRQTYGHIVTGQGP